MTGAQNYFYIIASIALSLIALLMLFSIISLAVVIRKMNRILHRYHAIANELHQIAHDAKSYSRYIGASLASRFFMIILRVLRKSRHARETNF